MPYQINDPVFYAYTVGTVGYYSAATITALGATEPAQHADLHVTPIAPIAAFDVTDKLHKAILVPNRWCDPDEIDDADPGGCVGGLR